MGEVAGERSTLRQHMDRDVAVRSGEFLELGTVAHVGFCVDGQPYVIPMSYQYSQAHPGKLYLHGGRPSRLLRTLCEGGAVCVTVTMVDGLVYSKSAMCHSMNYRSVMAFGRGREVIDSGQKAALLDAMIARYHSGRTVGVDYEAATVAQLEATLVVEIVIEEMSAKARFGGPAGPKDADENAQGSSGVVQWTDGLQGPR